MRLARVVEPPTDRFRHLQLLKALGAFVDASDYTRCSNGLMQDGPGQFRTLDASELEARLAARQIYAIGAITSLDALAIVAPTPWFGPNPIVCFLAGRDASSTMAMLDDLRCLIPAEHPRGPAAAEVSGHTPV